MVAVVDILDLDRHDDVNMGYFVDDVVLDAATMMMQLKRRSNATIDISSYYFSYCQIYCFDFDM